MKKILYTFFLLLGGVLLFTNTSVAQVGIYTLTGTDSFGDGWNGAQVDIINSNGTTIPFSVVGAGPQSIMFTVAAGEIVNVCEVAAGAFPGEIAYNVTGPTGATVLNVGLGGYTGPGAASAGAGAGTLPGLPTCFEIRGEPIPSANCGLGECLFAPVLNLELAGFDAAGDTGDGWEGSTLTVTINGQTSPAMTIGDPAVTGAVSQFVFAPVCLVPGETVDVDVAFNDLSVLDDDEISWEISFGSGFEIDDPMNLLVNPGGGLADQGDLSSTGTVVVTCPIEEPSTPPVVSCGIYEVGKSDFLQSPSATAQCTNGFNCGVMNNSCADDATASFVGNLVPLTVPGPGAGGLPNASFAPITVPASIDPASPTFLGVTYELCAAGDFDNPVEIADFLINGNVIGSVGVPGGFANQCNGTQGCVTVTVCGGAMIGDDIVVDFVDQNGNAGFCNADLTVTPTFLYGPADNSGQTLACISWFSSEDTSGDPLFVGQTLPFNVIQTLIASGDLDASLLCHEQQVTLFITTSCGVVQSDPVPVNIFVFNPCTDGCALYVEMTDGGADGWEGASLTVSENNGPNQELKLTASDGGCSVTQFCVADGGTLDLQYWEGADNFEHGYNVIDASGNALVTNGPGPSTEVTTAKADCNVAACEGELLDLSVRVIYGTNSEFLSWEIYDGFDNVNCQGPQIYGNLGTAGLPPGFRFIDENAITVNACEEYTVVLYDGGNNTGSGATFELITSNINYGTEIINPAPPEEFFGQSQLLLITGADFGPEVGEARVSFTIPCEPECVDASQIVVAGSCVGTDFVLPIGTPAVCPECNHGLGCDIQFRHTVLLDGNPANTVALNAFAPIDGQTEFNYFAAFGGVQAGCHSYVTEFQYCDGLISKCTANYTVFAAQTSNFACNDNVTIPLSTPDGNPLNGGFVGAQNDDLGECVIEVTADLLIEGGVPSILGCEFNNFNDFYEVIILDENDQPLVVFSDNPNGPLPLDSNGAEILPGSNIQPANNFVSYNEIKETLKFVVTHKVTGTTCWGFLTVEDKNAPTITAADYDVNCNDPNAMDEFYAETITYNSSAAASEFPANIQGGDGGIGAGQSNTWIPFTVGCGRLGVSITDININIDLFHTDPTTDIGLDFIIPSSLNNTLAMPFPNNTISIRPVGGLNTGSSTFTPAPNDTPILGALLGASAKVIQSEKDIDFISNSSGTGPGAQPQGFGKTYYLNVFDVEDSQAGPTPFGDGFINSASITISLGYPFPYAAFDCALDNVELVSEIVEDNCDLLADWIGARIVRVWRATDECGNAANATQIVNLLAPRITDLTLPAEDVSIECGTEMLDADGAIDPAQSGAPVFCCDEVTDEDFCKLSISFEDNVLESCGNSLKIFRTWSIFNWCNPTAPTQLTQIIVVEDTTPPMVNGGTTITVSANADCEGELDLSNLDITDGCSEVTAIRFEFQTGSVYAGTGAVQIIDLLAGEMVSGLPLGDLTGTIIATDECGNTSRTDATISVVDTAIPTAICDDGLIISLNSDGQARLFATDFDEGSNDNCSDVTVEIRSLGALGAGFGESADFDCADLGTVRVELLVTDAAGNTNICWSDLLVEDPIGPSIVCKDDVTLTCDEALHADDVFSAPDAFDNCGATVEAGDIITQDLPMCGQILTQTWTATDGSDKTDPASCTQTVTITHVSDFIVQFPADQEFENCELGDINGPIVTDDECENIGISVEDRVFVQVDDACYKIERTYTVINHYQSLIHLEMMMDSSSLLRLLRYRIT